MNNILPSFTRNLSLAYFISLIVVLLMAGLSLAGLLFQSNIYPNEELRRTFVSNDVVNLFIGLLHPIHFIRARYRKIGYMSLFT